ncbi:MAG: serine/threonine protein kinase [Burkholderiaceae bacterium]|nr:MAG: serine/threonine protein kinase [Burkholderiaceae bacterium]
MAEERLGRYLLQDIIGQGAMGTVYRAHDPVLDRIVAIKTIRLDLNRAEREDFERRFQLEAQSSAKLNHPGIITVYDAGEVSNVAYIAMEYLQGRDLRELSKGHRLNHKQVASIAAQVADALAYAHQNGVVHRDVKPGNVMVLAKGRTKLMDFGIARLQTNEMTQAGTALGTPKYMSPELVSGQEADGRADIYSLGVVLYQMLTGVAPFEGETISATMYQILHEPAAHPSTLGIEISPGFSYILNRALAKRPQDRYETAKDMANDLRRVEELDLAPPRMRVLGLSKPVKITKPAAADPVDSQSSATVADEPTLKQRVVTTFRQPNTLRYTGVVSLLVLCLLTWNYFAGQMGTASTAVTQDNAVVSVQTAATPVQTIETDTSKPTAAGNSSAKTFAKPVKQEPALLRLAITPWGEVRVDGVSMGITPPTNQIPLEPGKHLVEIRNGGTPPYTENITVSAGETLTIKHRF